ncbi:unnamed protein product [Ranitomeya imitator]|uniref:G-protein coupled receptors family 1 profile domain-containing protein n=1 Tax=Ranitomeya imitator TaxID=111125 RepID=A0ABN9M3C6_9NEOB|nr:unnamed protein product [Ranitomeya imitator]
MSRGRRRGEYNNIFYFNSLFYTSDTDTRYHKNIGSRYRNSDTASIGRYPILAVSECSTLVIISFVQFLLTIISYVFIFFAIFKIRSSAGRMKAFSSCTSHLITVILFYGPLMFLYMKPESVESMEEDMLLSMLYIVAVPMLNPLVYSLRNKEVWEAAVTLTKEIKLKVYLRDQKFG